MWKVLIIKRRTEDKMTLTDWRRRPLLPSLMHHACSDIKNCSCVVKLYECENDLWCQRHLQTSSGEKKSPSVQPGSGLSYRWEATGFTTSHWSSATDADLPNRVTDPCLLYHPVFTAPSLLFRRMWIHTQFCTMLRSICLLFHLTISSNSNCILTQAQLRMFRAHLDHHERLKTVHWSLDWWLIKWPFSFSRLKAFRLSKVSIIL